MQILDGRAGGPVAHSRKELEEIKRQLERSIVSIQKELDQRTSTTDEYKYGWFDYAINAYRVFPSAERAYAEACIFFKDPESGPYKVHKVYI